MNRRFKKEHISVIRDSLLAGGCLVGMATLTVTSGFSVYSNLMGSGNLTFIEHPILTASLSILPAVGTFAVKAPVNLLDEKYRKPYTLVITGLSIVSLLTWLGFFAVSFHNNTGEMPDLSLLEDSDNSFNTIAYTVTQILSEMLVASTLFIYLDDLYSKYASDIWIDNPAYLNALKAYEHAKTNLKSLTHELSQKKGRRNRLLSLKQAYLTEQTAIYLQLASHLDSKR